MSILIIGSDGSMGTRYRAILRFLGKEALLADKDHNPDHIKCLADQSNGIIIATPTATHAQVIRTVMGSGKPILCEKPITKNVAELKELATQIKSPFRMVFQYQLLAGKNRIGRSHYDYFRHGNDGLVWDCLQIIALARSAPLLRETSPMWSSMINGKALNIAHMDAAYMAYVQAWFKYPAQDMGEIIGIHEKVDAFEKGFQFA